MKRTAFCKINLTLEILGTKRGDGFHDLRTVMHKIPLGDIVEIDVKSGNGTIELSCDSDVCKNEDNLAYRAAKVYLDAYNVRVGKNADVFIKLSKVTPTGAGLGGGSADAATVLDMLHLLLGGVTEENVLDMAKSLGSDVPFCLARYMSAYCEGRGELCRSIDVLPDGTCLVVAKPLESINTKGIYGEYDKMYGDDYSKSVSDEMEKALKDANLLEIGKLVVNDFESVCIPRLPEIDTIKKKIMSFGAVACQMSGSGSAVFGLFDDKTRCIECCEGLKNDGLCDVFAFTDEDFKKMYKGE